MTGYIPYERSAAALPDASAEAVIRLLADRFMADNPPTPYVWRTFDEFGIQADRKGAYHFDFDRRFPWAPVGARAIAIGELPCAQARPSGFVLSCHNPVQVLLNGQEVFASAGGRERSGEPDVFRVQLQKGMNRFVIIAEKTKIGFSCTLSNAMPQWEPCNYVMPFASRGGEAGFVYALTSANAPLPADAALWGNVELLPFLPAPAMRPLQDEGRYAAMGCFTLEAPAAVAWRCPPDVAMQVDGGNADALLAAGTHQLTMTGPLDALMQVSADGVTLRPPVPVHGRCSPLLVLPLAPGEEPVPLGRLTPSGEAWRPALRDMALRPYVETHLYGRWTYPLGVTLYGMLQAGQHLGDDRLSRYVHGHVKQVTGIHAYAEMDTARYGFAGVNQQICWLDALDDCGSFGALMLRTDPEGRDPDVRRMAERIGRYMMQEQPRTDAGAFCRRDQTIWADDMYMSVPFLCRLSAMTGDPAPLDFAAEQLLHYRELLFMPEEQVMAHMRCMMHDQHNGIPWSRGNGWVIFSLSELLQVLPAAHPRREALLDFFRQLTMGYLRLQDDCGMWHQILDDPESYAETSATAMFICAFMRGSRAGWYDAATADVARRAAHRAWDGLTRLAIGADGSLYGVCRGSGFSFSRAYYRALSWNFNDTHGVGIVMLAGVELLRG